MKRNEIVSAAGVAGLDSPVDELSRAEVVLALGNSNNITGWEFCVNLWSHAGLTGFNDSTIGIVRELLTK